MQTQSIDHVHIEVANKDAAADWYYKVLGLVRHVPHDTWSESPMGPLFLATSEGQLALALFARAHKPATRDHTIAFRTSAEQFLLFIAKLPDLRLVSTRTGTLLSGKGDVIDHDYSWSIYFTDPDGNRIEVTTYDYDQVAAQLSSSVE